MTSMRKEWLVTALIVALATLTTVGQAADSASDIFRLAPPGTVRLEGWIGEKLELCLNHRVWAQDTEKILEPLRKQNDNGSWRGEYFGKWYTSAALGYAMEPAESVKAKLEAIAREAVKTQGADGYLGSYDPKRRLKNWDVWCRKYVLLGLITAYDLSGDRTLLEAACRDADNLIAEAAKKEIKVIEVATPVLQGTADSSIIEPLALLAQRTGDRKYLEFAQSITAQWNAPYKSAPQGIHLLEKALAGEPPMKNHAYSIMSCFEGVCELYRATGDRQYLEAAVRFGQGVRRHERMINGSVSNQELFCDGARTQTEFLEQPQETCATVTWIKLCAQLLRLTGDPAWADEMELSLYNAMAGAMTPGGEWFAYHSPLSGERVPSHKQQANTGLSCCVASGPRGLLLTPRWAVMSAPEGPVVNLYAPGSASVKLADGSEVKVAQETDYPVSDRVRLTITPEGKRRFTLRLRIPAWSRQTTLTLNGQPVACAPGKYAKLEREWAPGDQVALTLDLRGRAVPAPSGAPQVALMRGPILLALDNRLDPTSATAFRLSTDAEGYVTLKLRADKPAWAWMLFDVPFQVHPSHFFNHYTVNLPLCDFASAGNAWSEKNLYRAWLPQPLLLSQAFAAETWKMMYPAAKERPSIPGVVRK